MIDIPLPQGWSEQPLSGLVAKLESGVSVNAEDRACGADEIGVLKTSCVNGGHFDPRENKVVLDRSEIRRAELNPRRDAILISRMNTFDLVGECAYVDRDYSHLFIPDRLWQTVIPSDANTCVKWLSYVVRSPLFRRSVSNAATGTSGSMKNISQPSYLGIRIRVPPPPEQCTIARILTTLDNLIEKTEALIAKYQAIKQGMMHDLFTRGIDAHGRLRPPPSEAPGLYKQSELGWIPKEWALSCVADEFHLSTGFTLGLHRRPKRNVKRYLRVANVQRDEILLDDIAELDATDGEFEPRRLEPDDLLVVEGHADPGQIGRCAIVTRESAGLTFQNHLFRLRCRKVLPRFACDWLNSEIARRYWLCRCATSSGLNTINQTTLKKMPFLVPHPDEQAEIATRTDAESAFIKGMQVSLFKSRHIKSGLMQDLLTGKVRVKVDEREEVADA